MNDKKIVIVFFSLVILTLAAYTYLQMRPARAARKSGAVPTGFSSLGNPSNTTTAAASPSSVIELAQQKGTVGTIGTPTASQQSAWLSQFTIGTGVPSL
ncbi:MAG: hypothetical protein ACYDBH_12310 [Acidobacteriaceae bacterium]